LTAAKANGKNEVYVVVNQSVSFSLDGDCGTDADTDSYSDPIPDPTEDVTCTWSFGDGSPDVQDCSAGHTYTTPGTYTVSVSCTDEGRRPGPEEDGNRDDTDPPAKSCTVHVCGGKHPTNFRQVMGVDAGNGVLYFEYNWNSTSGNVLDLVDCEISEYVVYADLSINPYYPPDPPFAAWEEKNLTIRFAAATPGWCGDYHFPAGNIRTPYVSGSYTAQQVYRFHCKLCMAAGVYQTLKGPHAIYRGVEQQPTWRYRCVKSGVNAIIVFP
jgi:hypothetical protein